jgi:hypothetical protein
MSFVEEEKALAAWFAAARTVAETSVDDPLRSLVERVVEGYRLRYERVRRPAQRPLRRSRRWPVSGQPLI